MLNIQDNKYWPFIKEVGEAVIAVLILFLLMRLVLGSPMPLVVVTSGSMMHENNDWNIWLLDHQIVQETIDGFPMTGGFSKGDIIVTRRPDVTLGDIVIYKRDEWNNDRAKDPIIHRVVGIVYIENWEVSKVVGTISEVDEADFREVYIPIMKNCSQNIEVQFDNKRECPYPVKGKGDGSGSMKFYITKGDNNDIIDQYPYKQSGGRIVQDKTGSIALPVSDDQLYAEAWIKIPWLGYIKLWMVDIISIFTG